MGSWDETCGVSNLNIQEGDRVRLLILERSQDTLKHNAGFSYADSLWKPRYLPVVGYYNSYGTIENIVKGLNTQIITADAVSSLGWMGYVTIETLLEDIERDRTQLGQMFVHEDVYQHMVTAGIWGDRGPYLGPSSPARVDPSTHVYYNALKTLGRTVSNAGAFLSVKQTVKLEDEDDDVKQLREMSLEYMRFASSMSRLRKFFSPQSGRGSQDSNDQELMALHYTVKKIIQKRTKRWRE